MTTSKGRRLEREIVTSLARRLREQGLFVIPEARVMSCEMDVVVFDPVSLRMAAIEVKREGWREVLSQADKRKLYCHFAVAVLPARLKESIEEEEFSSRGVGLCYYTESRSRVGFQLAHQPSLHTSQNRSLKQRLYQLFAARFGERMYA